MMKGTWHPYEKDAMNAMGGNMEDNRKKWIRPQLIVLGRGTPEENVLAGCKTSKLTGAAATITSCKKKSTKKACQRSKCSVISKTS
jgi:hypothetical protein